MQHLRTKPENSVCVPESTKGSKFFAIENKPTDFGKWAMTHYWAGKVDPGLLPPAPSA